ncbi:rhamnan synthesis F family protein [Leptospira jelokensis]|uniref:rhamnan synthesis F family protein n=1 Tax=Leptospira jelokensis TaxID=2484931 RepID=UPI001090F5D4|nr:rhamnan synthesis F family protein [Leptospira jelokensis]TGL99239.1 hypothetical protein EHQ79_15620 [Leptospira jelokensis]
MKTQNDTTMLKYTKKSNFIIFKELVLKFLFLFINTKSFRFVLLNKKPQIFDSIPITGKQSNRLVLFSTFTTDGKIKESLVYYLSNLKKIKSDIILIDTSLKRIPSELEKIQPYLRHYIWRENIGYDFGSWKIGISEIPDWKIYSQIILTNDSIYGPIHPLEPIFEKFNSSDIDIWGLTDSYELSYHLMSYFLVFQNKIIQSKEFENFWETMVYFPTTWKKFLILAYEVGGYKYWKNFGFKTDAYIKFETLTQTIFKNHYNNPTHVFWDKIISDLKFPFLKKDLTRKKLSPNELDEIRQVLVKTSPKVLEFVEKEKTII